MRLLKLGSHGNDVRLWQSLLDKQGYDAGVPDGIFGRKTREATQKFQLDHHLSADGLVGNNTFAAANAPGNGKQSGNSVAGNHDHDLDQNYPDPPPFSALYGKEREALFGGFRYTVNTDGSINIQDNWVATHIRLIQIPELKGVKNPYNHYKPISGKVYFHEKIAGQVRDFFGELGKEGLDKKILTWGGSFVPRLVRGSSTRLSNHSFGTAFDINMEWNRLGQMPALAGEKGSVRDLVTIANKYGFFWGGHYHTRKDGMHFEIAKIL